MRGNEKIAFTAEAVAFMRHLRKSDKFSKYFVSPEIEKKFQRVAKFIPSYLAKISKKRVALSKDLDKVIKEYKPEQIIELACGYSPRALILTQKNSKLIYLETDFKPVIQRKKKILKEIAKKENLVLSKNHHLIEMDAISKYLASSIKISLNKNKKTLIIAETLTSYLDKSEHEFLIKNIIDFSNQFKKIAYLSHEGIGMLPGIKGKLLLFYRNRIAKTKSHTHFRSSLEIKDYFRKKGFKSIDISKSKKSRNFIYLANFR